MMSFPAQSTSGVTVVPVESKAQWRAFHHLPFKIYRDDPNWVPPLLIEREMHFKPGHNAFFKHAKAAFFLALKNGEPVGRITAQIDALHLEQHHDATGHFGYLEAIDDIEVFKALLSTAEAWLKSQGMQRVLGPVSFQMWDEPGLLVEGFDTPPKVLMGHHQPYYQHRIAEAGYEKAEDVLAYEYPLQEPFAPDLQRILKRTERKTDLVFRPIRMDKANFPKDVALIRDIINDAWAENWGFVPMTEAEVEEIATLFKVFLKPDALVFGEHNGEAIGVGLMLPNINEAIHDLKGKLFPFGILKMLYRLKFKGVKAGRLALMGIRRKYWGTPVGALVSMRMIENCQKSELVRNAVVGEVSWILDSNERIKAMITAFGCKQNKRYRIFQKAI